MKNVLADGRLTQRGGGLWVPPGQYNRGEIYEPFMGLKTVKSQVEFTPPQPGQLGR